MKTVINDFGINDFGSVEVITDAFKIVVSENDEFIHIKVLDFDYERKHSWNILQTQTIEKKLEHSKSILNHVHEQIDKEID